MHRIHVAFYLIRDTSFKNTKTENLFSLLKKKSVIRLLYTHNYLVLASALFFAVVEIEAD